MPSGRDRTSSPAKRSSSLQRGGATRPPVTIEDPRDASWEKLPESNSEPEENETEAISPAFPSPTPRTTEPSAKLPRDTLKKAWERMAVELIQVADVGQATKMIQEMRAEATGAMNYLNCPHPEWAIWESGNQHIRYEKCLRCSSRVWSRPLTAAERQAQLSRKAEKEARRVAKSKYQDPSQKMEDHGLVSFRKMNETVAAASSGSAGTTAGTSGSEVGQVKAAIQANSAAVSRLALAIQQLTQQKN